MLINVCHPYKRERETVILVTSSDEIKMKIRNVDLAASSKFVFDILFQLMFILNSCIWF